MPLFKEINHTLSSLVSDISLGRIGLPDLQRPFVWPNKKVRDLFDSMYRGYPVGYLLFWENGSLDRSRTIGTDRKAAEPFLVVIDGQQRLTSLYAVLRGANVKRESFTEERIQIAFRPLDEKFEVTDAAIRKDPRWIADISSIWAANSDLFELADSYLEGLNATEPLVGDDRRRIRQRIMKLAQLTSFPFTALQLSSELDEEQVSHIFVRINSKGTPLNQADFILTLMSVFKDDLRRGLEEFCRQCRIPSRSKASPFNYYLEPDPDHLLRVAVGLGFRRARLQHVYNILRGKDLETGEFSPERREAQFMVLEEAQAHVLSSQSWKEFLKAIADAGYRSGQVISSRNAMLFTYIYFLIARRDFSVPYRELANLIARWFFFVALTGRYTDSPETRMEQDLADLRELKDANEFRQHLDRRIAAAFTPDYWTITLPSELATSSPQSPGLFAYYAALVLLDARVLFSRRKVAYLLDPSTRAARSALERHHLFPKAHLKRQGVASVRDTNQIANYALLEWPDNSEIKDRDPASYFPEIFSRLNAEEQSLQLFWHALPDHWPAMAYSDFLRERRRRIADVIKAGYEVLCQGTGHSDFARETPAEPAEITMRSGLAAQTFELLSKEAGQVLAGLLDEPMEEEASVAKEVSAYLDHLEDASQSRELDLDRARRVAERCLALLGAMSEEKPVEQRRLVQAAVRYVLLHEDAEHDLTAFGLLDDEEVVEAVELVLASAPLDPERVM